jgi:hypothetical protein
MQTTLNYEAGNSRSQEEDTSVTDETTFLCGSPGVDNIQESACEEPYTPQTQRNHGLENLAGNIVNTPISPRFCSFVRSSLLLTVLCGAGHVLAQDAAESSTLEPLPPAAINPPETVTVDRLQIDEIRQLIREGLDEQIITQMVRERGIARPLLVGDLVSLRRAGVSNELIKEIQKGAPKARVYALEPPTLVSVYEEPPPAVIVRPVPRYYVSPGPHIYVWPSFHHPPMSPHSRGGGRVNFGFSF